MSKIKRIEKLFERGDITRRVFLTQMSAMGLTATISPILLNKKVFAATPKRGGTFRIGTAGGNLTDSLAPETVTGYMAMLITMQIRNCLVEIDHKFNLQPGLATSWEPSSDAKKWVFKLRKGVEFHNGKSMDAEDVVYSINLHREEKSKSAAKVHADSIEKIEVDDKHTLIFTLKDGNADFPFALNDYHFQIVPKGTTNFEDGIGTGPFIMKSFEPGVNFSAKRNPNYWNEGKPFFDEVETFAINDLSSRTNALMSGKIDIMNKCDVKTLNLLQQKAGINVIEVSGKKHYTFPMRVDLPPFNNNDVRLALKYAIDREQILKLILKGHGILGNDHPISPSYKYYSSEIEQREYDPEKAKYHLKKAGFQDYNFKLSTSDTAFSGAVDAAVLYKENAAKAGLNIEVIREPEDGYWSNVWRKKALCMSVWMGRPTENSMFSVGWAKDAAWNDMFWKNERFNKLLIEARSELDKTKRKEMYTEMQKICRDDGGSIIPVFANLLYAASTKVKYEAISSVHEWDNHKIAENCWFES